MSGRYAVFAFRGDQNKPMTIGRIFPDKKFLVDSQQIFIPLSELINEFWLVMMSGLSKKQVWKKIKKKIKKKKVTVFFEADEVTDHFYVVIKSLFFCL